MSDARTDIEEKLLSAQEGQLEIDQFMEALLSAQLFMPIHDDAQGSASAAGGRMPVAAGTHIINFQRSTRAQPLTIDGEDGCKQLVLFTSPDRARDFVRNHPGYGGGILTDLPWIFENLGVGFGIRLNPGHDIGLDLEAADVAQLAEQTH